MDLSINVGYFGPHITDNHKLIKDLDELGVSCVWTAEAYGYDAVTPLAYFAALTTNMEIGSGIMQIPGRTPAMTAMTAVTLDKMSNGRFRLGLGVSGPQVVEGWHGVPYGKPLAKTREYVQLVKEILKRDGKSRKMEIAQARQVSMFLSREILGKSLSGIGMYFGGRDHTTVMHAIKTISEKVDTDDVISNTISKLRTDLNQSF